MADDLDPAAVLLRECDLADADMRKWVRVPVKTVRAALAVASDGDAVKALDLLDVLVAVGMTSERLAEAFCEPVHRDRWPLAGENRYCGHCIEKADRLMKREGS